MTRRFSLLTVGLLVALLLAPPLLRAENAAEPENRASLEDQVDTLELDLLSCKTELVAATEKLDAARAAGRMEESDRLKHEIGDVRARLDQKSADLKQSEALLVLIPAQIAPGDELAVAVREMPEFDGEYTVHRGGYIIVPNVGRVALVDRNDAGAQKAFEKALRNAVGLPANASLSVTSETISIGEALMISVDGKATLDGKYLVQGDGSIAIQGVGNVKLAGRSFSRATRQLRRALVRAGIPIGIVTTTPIERKKDEKPSAEKA